MRKLFLATLVFVSFSMANAQSKTSGGKLTFGAGPVLSLPIGDFGQAYSLGYGAEFQLTYEASTNFQGFAQVGYSSFSIKSSLGSGSTGFLPILVGGRYVSNGLSFGAGIGYGSFSGGGSSSGGFAYSPQVGYSFGKSQLIGSYNGISTSGSTSSFIGVKFFYGF
jgi:hypothetical protein